MNKIKNKNVKKKEQIVILLMLVLFVFAFYGGDYYHMKEDFRDIKSGEIIIEYPYMFIANYLSFDYSSFRMVVWGLMLLLIVNTYRRLPQSNFSIFVLAIVFVLTLSYARVGLAMAIMFYGASFLVDPQKRHKILSFILGLSLMFISYYFHKSALFGIIILLFSFLVRKLNKLIVLLAVILIPLVAALLKSLVASFLYDASKLENIVNVERGLHYMYDDYASSFGLGMIIQNTLSWSPFYLTTLLILMLIFENRYSTLNKSAQFYGNTTLFIVGIATCFGLIDFGVNTNLFYYRFLNFAIIPMCFFTAYCLKIGLHKRLIYFFLITGFMGSVYSLLYRYYLAI